MTRARIILRIIFYGAFLGFIYASQPALRCLYNPFQEDDVTSPCLQAGRTALLPETFRVSAYGIASRIYLLRRDFPEAAAVVAESYRLAPSYSKQMQVTSILTTAGTLEMTHGDMARAIAHFTEALSYNAAYGDARYRRGQAYQSTQQLAQAVGDYSELIRRSPTDNTGYAARARIYVELGRNVEALEDLTALLKTSRRNAWAWSARAEARRELGDNEGAIADAEVALTLQHLNRAAYATEIQALLASGRGTDSETVIARWEVAEGGATALTENWRADSLEAKGAFQAALAALDRAARLDPGDSRALRRRAYIKWRYTKDSSGALDDADQAIALGDTLAPDLRREIAAQTR